METDLHFLTITDKTNIPVPLEIDTEYQVVGEISTWNEGKSSNQDGTYSHTHKARFIGEIQLIKGEKVIRGQKKSSASQKWRRLVEGYGFQYDAWMQWQFSKFDEMKEEYEANTHEATPTDS